MSGLEKWNFTAQKVGERPQSVFVPGSNISQTPESAPNKHNVESQVRSEVSEGSLENFTEESIAQYLENGMHGKIQLRSKISTFALVSPEYSREALKNLREKILDPATTSSEIYTALCAYLSTNQTAKTRGNETTPLRGADDAENTEIVALYQKGSAEIQRCATRLFNASKENPASLFVMADGLYVKEYQPLLRDVREQLRLLNYNIDLETGVVVDAELSERIRDNLAKLDRLSTTITTSYLKEDYAKAQEQFEQYKNNVTEYYGRYRGNAGNTAERLQRFSSKLFGIGAGRETEALTLESQKYEKALRSHIEPLFALLNTRIDERIAEGKGNPEELKRFQAVLERRIIAHYVVTKLKALREAQEHAFVENEEDTLRFLRDAWNTIPEHKRKIFVLIASSTLGAGAAALTSGVAAVGPYLLRQMASVATGATLGAGIGALTGHVVEQKLASVIASAEREKREAQHSVDTLSTFNDIHTANINEREKTAEHIRITEGAKLQKATMEKAAALLVGNLGTGAMNGNIFSGLSVDFKDLTAEILELMTTGNTDQFSSSGTSTFMRSTFKKSA